MIGFFDGLNIVDITELFSPPRVANQGERQGLKAGSSMEYDQKGLKCMDELNKNELECLVKDMLDTAEEFISEGMTSCKIRPNQDDQCSARTSKTSDHTSPRFVQQHRRVEDTQEDADKQSSEPKPISRKVRWADLDEEEKEEELQSLRLKIEEDLVKNSRTKAIMQLKHDKGCSR